MDEKREIIDRINKISQKGFSQYEIFSDWIRCSSLAISNSLQIFHTKLWESREKEYMDTMRRYAEGGHLFSEMTGLLCMSLEKKMEDVLGSIYMMSGMGSAATGQFFTPYHLSELCASLILPQADENGIYRIQEPSCGGGGMIIAAAKTLRDAGINYQRKMDVVAQDLDWKGVYMTYLQLSLLGIPAVCVQGDTLSTPYAEGYPPEKVLYTPAKVGALL